MEEGSSKAEKEVKGKNKEKGKWKKKGKEKEQDTREKTKKKKSNLVNLNLIGKRDILHMQGSNVVWKLTSVSRIPHLSIDVFSVVTNLVGLAKLLIDGSNLYVQENGREFHNKSTEENLGPGIALKTTESLHKSYRMFFW